MVLIFQDPVLPERIQAMPCTLKFCNECLHILTDAEVEPKD